MLPPKFLQWQLLNQDDGRRKRALMYNIVMTKSVQNISEKYTGIKFQVSGCCKTEHKKHTIFFTYLEIYWHLWWQVFFSNLTCIAVWEIKHLLCPCTTILTYIDTAYFYQICRNTYEQEEKTILTIKAPWIVILA
jgi:hypothetical protein